MCGVQHAASSLRLTSFLSGPIKAKWQAGPRRRDGRAITNRVESSATLTAIVASGDLQLTFSVPRRVDFGHHLLIVGSNDKLGGWDVGRGVQMQWTEGDVWVAELQVPAAERLALEYKYVVQDDHGVAVEWKPGANCELQLALPPKVPPGAKVHVEDDWERCAARIAVDLPQLPESSFSGKSRPKQQPRNGTASSSSSRTATLDDAASTAARRSAAARQAMSIDPAYGKLQQGADPQALGADAGTITAAGFDGGAAGAPAVLRQASGTGLNGSGSFLGGGLDELDELDVVAAAAEQAMQRLDTAITSSTELLDSLYDPASLEAFEADRRVAAAARKAIALTRALTAADPRRSLPAARRRRRPGGRTPPSRPAEQPDGQCQPEGGQGNA